MFRVLRSIVLLLLAGPVIALSAPGFVAAQEGLGPRPQLVERIAAVVNDEIISLSDLEARLQLALLSSGLPDTQEARDRLRPQVLRALVDEKLQRQEATRAGLTATEEEVQAALGQLAEQNRMSVPQMETYLASRGVPVSTLRTQIETNILWSKVVQRRLRPTIEIGDEEIDAAMERIRANAGKPEYLVSEIFLAVDTPQQDEEVRRLAERLVEQIRAGASFAAVASQFSQSTSAATGGDIGWVQQGQLSEQLDNVLQQLQPGRFSPPIRSLTGYHILALRDRRTVLAGNQQQMRVSLKQIFLPVQGQEGPSGVDAVLARAEALRGRLNGCDAMETVADQTAGSMSGDAGTVTIADLPPELGRIVADLPIGQPTPPLRNEQGVLILMVCDRVMPPSSLPDRTAIANSIGMERLDMLQRRLIRDLRRAAFVDVRV